MQKDKDSESSYMVEPSSIVFPGRFQPVTNAHLDRLRWIVDVFPKAKVTVVIGDVGALNRANFLTVGERREIFLRILSLECALKHVSVACVAGCADANHWAKSVIGKVPDADAVVSDNLFAIQPLQKIGLAAIRFERNNMNASALREQPVENWISQIPEIEMKLLRYWEVETRLKMLRGEEKYPFLHGEACDGARN